MKTEFEKLIEHLKTIGEQNIVDLFSAFPSDDSLEIKTIEDLNIEIESEMSYWE